MIPERTFNSEEELRAHYKDVLSRRDRPALPKPQGVDGASTDLEPPEPAKSRRKPATGRQSVASIIAEVAAEHGVTSEVILSYDRDQKALAARQAAIDAAYRTWGDIRGVPWLAAQFKRNHVSIHWWLRKAGLKPPVIKGRKRSEYAGRKLSDEQELEACDLYRSGLTCDKVGQHFGVSNGCIWQLLVRKNIPRRPPLATRFKPKAKI